ncbi:MAG: hypothetical protein KGK18_03845, partial [Burkholderiales bacterium]|nr:hypothetical protein [Burkholderiales bacterium]
AFYRHAPTTGLTAAQYQARLRRGQADNRAVLLRPPSQLRDAARTLDRFDAKLLEHGALLGARAQNGKVVEGHGDLRPEHVWLLKPPVVIDCLEFNARLRQVDPFDEIAFLALECGMAGAPWIGAHLLEGCSIALADRPGAALWWLYTANAALRRARLAMAHLLDAVPRTPARWPPLAQRYLERAQIALDALDALDAVSATTNRGTP